MLTFGSKINRSYTMYLPFKTDHVEVSVMFNKSNTYLGFNTDQTLYQMHRNNEIHSQIFKDLRESSFATTFLDLREFKSKNLDIRQQFHNILPQFEDKIQYVANETVKLSKVQTKNGQFESSLYIFVFNFSDYENDFLFFLVERQHIDIVLDKKLVRTCGLQICTNDVHEDLLKMIECYNSDLVKTEKVDDVMKSLFPHKNNIKCRRL